MSHHHHHHHGNGETKSALSFDEKLLKILDHWIRHNCDHAETYTDWANKAKENDLSKVVGLLNEAAEMTVAINEKFEKALEMLKRDADNIP